MFTVVLKLGYIHYLIKHSILKGLLLERLCLRLREIKADTYRYCVYIKLIHFVVSLIELHLYSRPPKHIRSITTALIVERVSVCRQTLFRETQY